jgi:hypothetical protein
MIDELLGRVPPERRCTRCGLRWSQSKLGLCRSCERDVGIILSSQERDREALARQQEALAALERVQRPRIEREVVIIETHRVDGVPRHVPVTYLAWVP